MNLTQLEAEIFSLPLQDRAALAQRLLLSLEDVSESEFEQLWGDESVRRLAEFDAGKVKSISGKAVAEKARALLR
ncbi:MAG: addiction module antitoxin RelB [Proteobacteria bacterium ST_bin11]|jgi:putative addiction module component (TIGR02574 family)|nr:MAG: addiction module antitoxin RelB [Proteobacteria bacterium ST_bin11]